MLAELLSCKLLLYFKHIDGTCYMVKCDHILTLQHWSLHGTPWSRMAQGDQADSVQGNEEDKN